MTQAQDAQASLRGWSARSMVLALAVCAGLSTTALAQGGSGAAPSATQAPAAERAMLLPGDAAPALSIHTWVKGAPVSSFERGKIYVVEFWATWCGPCRVSIPHLTELQKKYQDKNVTIIGISSNEEKGLADVQPFVERQGDGMAYTVAWDDAGRTSDAWMEAAGQNGIPTAFVVNQEGKIAWIGHPMDKLDEVLEKTVAGTWDVAAERTRAEVDARETATYTRLVQRIRPLVRAGNLAEAIPLMEEAVRTVPSKAGREAMMVLSHHLTETKNYEAGYAWAARLVDEVYKDSSAELNAIAWMIATEEGIEQRNLDVALRAASRANTLTEEKSPDVLDTLARVHWERGEKVKAVEVQERAAALATDQRTMDALQATLDRYRSEM